MDWEALYCPNKCCSCYGFRQGKMVKNGSSNGQLQALCNCMWEQCISQLCQPIKTRKKKGNKPKKLFREYHSNEKFLLTLMRRVLKSLPKHKKILLSKNKSVAYFHELYWSVDAHELWALQLCVSLTTTG